MLLWSSSMDPTSGTVLLTVPAASSFAAAKAAELEASGTTGITVTVLGATLILTAAWADASALMNSGLAS